MKFLSGDFTIADQKKIVQWAKTHGNNVVSRQLQESCHDLYDFDISTPLNTVSFECKKEERFFCYGCGHLSRRTHSVYVFSCKLCGNKFQKYRHLTRDLTGHTAVVIGGRTKLGHQVIVKLLNAGAIVIGTTRYPDRALELFQKYTHWDTWKDNLHFYPKSFDLDTTDIQKTTEGLAEYVRSVSESLDILVNCAAQTIRVREKEKTFNNTEQNRYGDAKFVKETHVNSWQMDFSDLIQSEMEEVYRINAVAPSIVIQNMIPIMQKSSRQPYIINVHAREGLFNVTKNQKHIHTNMAKAGLAMLTKCLKSCRLKTDNGVLFGIHGCDCGWISIDEYYESNVPWIVPPLDEIDGAARILFPVFQKLPGSTMKTRRHFDQLTY